MERGKKERKAGKGRASRRRDRCWVLSVVELASFYTFFALASTRGGPCVPDVKQCAARRAAVATSERASDIDASHASLRPHLSSHAYRVSNCNRESRSPSPDPAYAARARVPVPNYALPTRLSRPAIATAPLSPPANIVSSLLSTHRHRS